MIFFPEAFHAFWKSHSKKFQRRDEGKERTKRKSIDQSRWKEKMGKNHSSFVHPRWINLVGDNSPIRSSPLLIPGNNYQSPPRFCFTIVWYSIRAWERAFGFNFYFFSSFLFFCFPEKAMQRRPSPRRVGFDWIIKSTQ